MASPKPKPTQIRKIEGNPSRRPLPDNEPAPIIDAVIPRAPKHLSPLARKEWNIMTKRLHRLGLLTEIDYPALAMYCQNYGRWVEAEEKIKVTGYVIKTKNGNIINSPMVSIANRSMELAHKFLTEFGMTPSSRTKVTVAGVGKKSKFAGLIPSDGKK